MPNLAALRTVYCLKENDLSKESTTCLLQCSGLEDTDFGAFYLGTE
jgi:hypothetical protein